MKSLRRVPLLALLALTSCGIPATGVVQAAWPRQRDSPSDPGLLRRQERRARRDAPHDRGAG